MSNSALDLLKTAKIEVSPETYFLVALSDIEWRKLLENPKLSPRMTVPFMIFKDQHEITLVLDEVDYQTCRHALSDSKIEGNWRLLTFDLVLDFNVIGFLAEISKILADSKIPIMAISAFSRDHLLIKQNDLAKALRVLGEVVEELC